MFGSGAKAAEAAAGPASGGARPAVGEVRVPAVRTDARAAQVLGRTHAALDGVKAGILRFLGACPGARPADLRGSLFVLGPAQRRASVLCLAGPAGTGKISLVHAVAEALGRTSVTVSVDGKATKRQIHGS